MIQEKQNEYYELTENYICVGSFAFHPLPEGYSEVVRDDGQLPSNQGRVTAVRESRIRNKHISWTDDGALITSGYPKKPVTN